MIDPFLLLLASEDLPKPELEYRFALGRKYRADYCWPRDELILQNGEWSRPRWGVIVEKQGGVWQKGGHSSPLGIQRDWAKSNLAQLLGYTYLQYSPKQLLEASTIRVLKELLR